MNLFIKIAKLFMQFNVASSREQLDLRNDVQWKYRCYYDAVHKLFMMQICYNYSFVSH